MVVCGGREVRRREKEGLWSPPGPAVVSPARSSKHTLRCVESSRGCRLRRAGTEVSQQAPETAEDKKRSDQTTGKSPSRGTGFVTKLGTTTSGVDCFATALTVPSVTTWFSAGQIHQRLQKALRLGQFCTESAIRACRTHSHFCFVWI